MSLLTSDLLDLNQTEHGLLFRDCKYPWEALMHIDRYLEHHLKPEIRGLVAPGAVIEGSVFIGEGTVVEPHAYIKGPAWIGQGCQVRHGAYLRGNVIAGNNCVLGNSCEFKNSVLFNEVQVPHFDYVGDSILGHHAHHASGVTLSNLKITKGNVEMMVDGSKVDTGLRKFGAIVGDHVDVGCHCVLNPGSILGRHSMLYPNISWRGICPPNTIVKLDQQQHRVIRTQ